MQIEDLKAWHWVVVGLVVGAVFSGVLSWAGPWFDTDAMDTVDAATFEHAVVGQLLRKNNPRLLRAFHDGQPVVKDVVIHPPLRGDPAHDWVTGKLYTIGPQPQDPTSRASKMVVAEQWVPFKYPAPIPFKGEVGAVGTFPTVREYLAAVAQTPAVAKVPAMAVRFRYAWQETPTATWTLPPLGGLLIIGVAWPMTLGAMASVGLARPPKVKAAKPKPAPVDDLPARPVTVGVRFVPPPSTAPKPLPAGDPKKYGGEFYPVVKNTEH